MNYKIETVKIKDLIDLFRKGDLLLNPPYQRNEIWSINSKKLLIDSINKNYPLPNFFVRLKSNDQWEMVDGQQRSWSIIHFFNNKFPSIQKIFYNANAFPNFLNYKLAIVFISDLTNDETIEDFYVRVNSTGMKLNRPELKKAAYFDTKFLNLLTELASDQVLVDLDLFSDTALNRMNDVDFVSELVTLMKFGITDKKDYVDKLFDDDIQDSEYQDFYSTFLKVINIFNEFNNVYPLKKTRYRQRNDFYTFFGFVYSNLNLDLTILKYFYSILTLIGEDISPSNEECEPFFNYALNCVSQSNSKQARLNRNLFLNELLLNETSKPNKTQSQIIEFYEIDENDFIKIGNYLEINIIALQSHVVTPKINFIYQ